MKKFAMLTTTIRPSLPIREGLSSFAQSTLLTQPTQRKASMFNTRRKTREELDKLRGQNEDFTRAYFSMKDERDTALRELDEALRHLDEAHADRAAAWAVAKEVHGELNLWRHNGVGSPQRKLKQLVELLDGWGAIIER